MSDFDGIITTSPAWVDIPSLSTSAIALGGSNGSGLMNAQAVALSQRTNYLFNYSIKIDPTSGNAGIGVAVPLGRFQIGDTSPNSANKIVFGKADSSSETNLPVIGQKSTGVGNDLVIASTSANGSVKIFTGNSNNSAEIGTGSNHQVVKITPDSKVAINSSTPIATLQIGDAIVKTSTVAYNMAFSDYSTLQSQYRILMNNPGSYWGFGTNGSNLIIGVGGNDATGSTIGTNLITGTQSGNIALGFVPSAWSAGRAIQLGSGTADGSIWSAGNDTEISTNVYYQSGWKYESTGYKATRYVQSSGAHSWDYAGVGTINSPVSWISGMLLDSNGNLGVGITPSAWIPNSRRVIQFGGSGNSSFIASSPGTANYLEVGSNYYIGTGFNSYYYAAGNATAYVQALGNHIWNTSIGGPSDSSVVWKEGLRLDYNNNLGIGVIPSAWSISGNLELAAGKVIAYDGDGNISSNSYFGTGGWKYKNSAASTLYTQQFGTHVWYTAPSGTAGAQVTYNQGMLLDGSNNLTVAGKASSGADATASADLVRYGQFLAQQYGRVRKISTITSGSGTYNFQSGTNAVILLAWGAGASGGYIPAGTTFRCASSGGNGTFLKIHGDIYTMLASAGASSDIVTGLIYSIGSGGIGTTTTVANGGNTTVKIATNNHPTGLCNLTVYGGTHSNPTYMSTSSTGTYITTSIPISTNISVAWDGSGYWNNLLELSSGTDQLQNRKPYSTTNTVEVTQQNYAGFGTVLVPITDGVADPTNSYQTVLDTNLSHARKGMGYGYGGTPAILPSGENRAQAGLSGGNGALIIIELG